MKYLEFDYNMFRIHRFFEIIPGTVKLVDKYYINDKYHINTIEHFKYNLYIVCQSLEDTSSSFCCEYTNDFKERINNYGSISYYIKDIILNYNFDRYLRKDKLKRLNEDLQL